MLLDIAMLGGFCIMLLGAVVFINKMPQLDLIKNSKQSKD